METTIDNRYRLEEPLDFSKDICEYRAVEIPTGNNVLVKILKDSRKSEKFFLESKILTMLEENGKEGFPRLFYEMSSDSLSVLVLTYYSSEHSLLRVFQHEKKVIPLDSIVCLTIVLLQRLRDLHTLGIIHNNINPRSYVISKTNDVYLIDFSVATFIDKSKFVKPTPENESSHQHRKFVGTMKFCSLNSHYGRPLTYKDDLESLLYSIIYLASGKLPWTENPPPNTLPNDNSSAKNHFYLVSKRDTPVEEICQDLPNEFRDFLADIRNIPKRSVDLPNYQKYIEMFLRLLNELILPQKAQPIAIPVNRFIKKLPPTITPNSTTETVLPSLAGNSSTKSDAQQSASSPSSSREFELQKPSAISQSASSTVQFPNKNDDLFPSNDQENLPANHKKINNLQFYYNTSSFISYNIAKLSTAHNHIDFTPVNQSQTSRPFEQHGTHRFDCNFVHRNAQTARPGQQSFSLLQNLQMLYGQPVVEGNSRMTSRIDLSLNKKHNLLYKTITSKTPPKS